MKRLSDDVKKRKKMKLWEMTKKLSSSQFQFIFLLSVTMCKKRESFVTFPHNSSETETSDTVGGFFLLPDKTNNAGKYCVIF